MLYSQLGMHSSRQVFSAQLFSLSQVMKRGWLDQTMVCIHKVLLFKCLVTRELDSGRESKCHYHYCGCSNL